jgi:hypothetical protein
MLLSMAALVPQSIPSDSKKALVATPKAKQMSRYDPPASQRKVIANFVLAVISLSK